MAENVCLDAGPSGKVDPTKRKKAHTVMQDGACLMEKKNNRSFTYMVLSAQTKKCKTQNRH